MADEEKNTTGEEQAATEEATGTAETVTEEVKEEAAAEEPATDEAPAEEAQAEETAEEEVEAVELKRSELEPGMVVRVHQRIKETNAKGEERERIQVFEGTIIAKKGQDPTSETVTVRKVSGGIGVERIFPVQSPMIAKFEVVKRYRVRRSKLYFLRNFKKRLKERKEKVAA